MLLGLDGFGPTFPGVPGVPRLVRAENREVQKQHDINSRDSPTNFLVHVPCLLCEIMPIQLETFNTMSLDFGTDGSKYLKGQGTL